MNVIYNSKPKNGLTLIYFGAMEIILSKIFLFVKRKLSFKYLFV